MIDEPDFEFPVDIHFQDCPVTLVDQLVGSDTPFMEEVGKEGFSTIEVPLQRRARRSLISSGRAVEVMA